MKAISYKKYGSPDNLVPAETDKPVPKKNEVLVKVCAVSINATDWEYLRGRPFYARIVGLFKPKKTILGSDIAGIVESAGGDVKKFRPGDEVYGDILYQLGGFAEYVCAPEENLLIKPSGLAFEEASTLPQASVIAYQGICTAGKVKKGGKVLINGGGGCVGIFATQLAKRQGAEVTCVDHTEKLDMMRSLGADHVIDYTKEDFTRLGKAYDLVLDVVANRSIFEYKRALTVKGAYYMVGGTMKVFFQALLIGPLVRLLERKKMTLLVVKPNLMDLAHMTELLEKGKIRSVIDRQYPLEKVPDALRYFGEGHPKGKIVITN